MNTDSYDLTNWREHLGAYLDGEMTSVDARRFLGWLEAHPAALKDAEESRRVWALLAAYADEPVPEGFAEGVIRSAKGADSVADRPPALRVLAGGRPRALAVAAAVLVAVGAGVLLLRRTPTEPSDASVSAALEAVPAELLESDNLASLASLSDEEFEAILAVDPETITADSSKKSGG